MEVCHWLRSYFYQPSPSIGKIETPLQMTSKENFPETLKSFFFICECIFSAEWVLVERKKNVCLFVSLSVFCVENSLVCKLGLKGKIFKIIFSFYEIILIQFFANFLAILNIKITSKLYIFILKLLIMQQYLRKVFQLTNTSKKLNKLIDSF